MRLLRRAIQIQQEKVVDIMDKKLNVAVLFGGMSSEHEVSRMSVTSIAANLSSETYDPYLIGITKAGRWLLYTGPVDEISTGAWENHPNNVPAIISPDASVGGMVVLRDGVAEVIKIDVVFPVLHGKLGEDGTIQGLLACSGLPFVGCDTLSSAVCMDKAITHSLLASANIEQAHYLWFFAERYADSAETIKNRITARLNYPVFVKPANAGSSVGISRVDDAAGLDEAIAIAAKEDRKIVVEEGIDGQEVECAVLGNQAPQASAVGEIGASAAFYDYDDKYINGTSQLYIPARIPNTVAEEIRKTAVRAYRLLGCSGLARVDFFVTKENKVILNEINTMPGFTDISMYPKLWMHMGMTYGELLDALISLAMEKAAMHGAGNGEAHG